MTPISLNPFRPTRWEHHSDGRPLIWFTEAAEALAVDKSTYVYGSRGSGKTTLLKGICWEDLAYNESLRTQKNLADFRHLGIYIRFPDHISASMSFFDWQRIFPNVSDPDYEFYRFFSLAIELICGEKALRACHELRLLDALTYSPSQELKVVADFAEEFDVAHCSGEITPRTFLDLARLFRNLVRAMNEACGRGTMAEIVNRLPVREPYQILGFLLEKLGAAARVKSQFGDRPAAFKFCLDDCEVLNNLQRKSLNSLVRLSRAPISWVISSVGSAKDDSDTFIMSQPLTDADRQVISLDGRRRVDFQRLCQSVVSLRLFFSISRERRASVSVENVGEFFDLDQRLGGRDVNDMISSMIRRSTRPVAREIHKAANRLLASLRKSRGKVARRYDRAAKRLPYYETYILLHWRGGEDAFRTEFTEADVLGINEFASRFGEPNFEAWLRRKQLGALLHLASTLGFRKLPLAGSNVTVSLADGSIRDFLEIMGEIFEEYISAHGWNGNDPTNLDRFAMARTQIAADVQTSGIYRASEAYLEGIRNRSELNTDTISRLVSGLGHYTSILQARVGDSRVLASAERGVFVVDYSNFVEPRDDSLDIQLVEGAIRQAELAGYLRTVEFRRPARSTQSDFPSRLAAFRLHRRFAPHFRFSYRGAYEPVSIDLRDLARLCRESPVVDPQSWAENLGGSTRSSSASQFMLPLVGLTDEE